MSTLIRATDAAALALHAAAAIAGARGARVSAGDIARALEASEAHTAKVLQRLSKAGLVKGRRGPGGGFTLTRPPGSITLREVYEAMEGPLLVQTCMLGAPVCNRKDCPLGSLFDRISEDVFRTLEGMTLDVIELQRRL